MNAVERLRAELSPRRWAGDAIAMGTNTDPYQRCEGKYRLTREVVEVLTEFAEPVLDPHQVDAGRCATSTCSPKRPSGPRCAVDFSIGTLDEDVWRLTEPGTPHPRRRLRAVRGVPRGRRVAAAC